MSTPRLHDLNLASVDLLAPILGRGRAELLVRWRHAHGSFGGWRAVMAVPGIGPTSLARLRESFFPFTVFTARETVIASDGLRAWAVDLATGLPVGDALWPDTASSAELPGLSLRAEGSSIIERAGGVELPPIRLGAEVRALVADPACGVAWALTAGDALWARHRDGRWRICCVDPQIRRIAPGGWGAPDRRDERPALLVQNANTRSTTARLSLRLADSGEPAAPPRSLHLRAGGALTIPLEAMAPGACRFRLESALPLSVRLVRGGATEEIGRGADLSGFAGWCLPTEERRIDLNTAGSAALEPLPGLGPVRAAEIVSWRESREPMARPDDLLAFDGVGDSVFLELEALVRAGERGLGPGEGEAPRWPADPPGVARGDEWVFIEPRTGLFTLREVDAVLRGREDLTLELARIYQPRLPDSENGLGPGWIWDLPFLDRGALHVGQGVFLAVPSGAERFEPEGERLSLRRVTWALEDGREARWELELAFRTWLLDAAGRPVALQGPVASDRLLLGWVGGRLAEVRVSAAESLTLRYAGKHLAELEHRPHRLTRSYTADGDGRLTGVTRGDGVRTTYWVNRGVICGLELPGGARIVLSLEGPEAKVRRRDHVTRPLDIRGTGERRYRVMAQLWSYETLPDGGVRTVIRTPAALTALEHAPIGGRWLLVQRGIWAPDSDPTQPDTALRLEQLTIRDAHTRLLTVTARGTTVRTTLLRFHGAQARWLEPVSVFQTAGDGAVLRDLSWAWGANPDLPVRCEGALSSWEIELDGHGLPKTLTQDPRGLRLVTRLHRDAVWGNLERIEEPDGVVETRSFVDARGLRRSAIAELTREGGGERLSWAYTYLEHAEPASISASGAGAVQFSRDAHGREIEAMDPDGHVHTTAWDDANDRVVRCAPGGLEEVLQGDGLGNLVSRTLRAGDASRLWWTEPDGNGRPSCLGAPGLAPVELGWDPLGRPLVERRADGSERRWVYEHRFGTFELEGHKVWGERVELWEPDRGTEERWIDPLGRTVGRRRALGDGKFYAEIVLYLDGGRKIATVRSGGETEVLTLDGLGRPAERVDALGGHSAWTWHPNGAAASCTDPDGRTTRWDFELGGALREVRYGPGRSQTFEARGFTRTLTDGDGVRWAERRDSLGRRVALEGPAAWRSAFQSLPGGGSVEVESGPDGAETRRVTNGFGELIEVTDPHGTLRRYERDGAGRVTAELDAQGRGFRWTYDALGRTATETDPLGRTTTFVYDRAGALIKVQDVWGGWRQILRDGVGRPIGELGPDGRGPRYELDVHGRPLRITDGDGHDRLFSYDVPGRTWTETGPDGVTRTWRLSAGGRPRSVTVQDQEPTTWRFDDEGRIAGIDLASGERLEVAERDAAGHPTKVSLGGLSLDWSWKDGQIRSAGAGQGGLHLDRDALGRPREVREPGGRAVHLTWSAGRLASARGADASWTWGLAAGKLSLRDSAGDTWEATTTLLGQIASWLDPRGQRSRVSIRPDGWVELVDRTERTWRWRHDPVAQVLEFEPPELGIFRTQVSPMGVPRTLTTPRQARWVYLHDEEGRFCGFVRPNDDGTPGVAAEPPPRPAALMGNPRAHVIRYDARGRPERMGAGGALTLHWLDPDKLQRIGGPDLYVNYVWDGDRLAQVQHAGSTTALSYQDDGRVVGLRSSGEEASEVTRTYEDGRLARRATGGLDIRYSYTGDRLTRVEANGYEVLLAWSADGRTVRRTLRKLDADPDTPSLQTLQVERDGEGRPVRVNGGRPFARTDHIPVINSTRVSYHPPVAVSYVYDALGRLIEENQEIFSPAPASTIPPGQSGRPLRPDSLSRAVRTLRYDYEGLGLRLRTWTGPDEYEARTFDDAHNPTGRWRMFTDGRPAVWLGGQSWHPDGRPRAAANGDPIDTDATGAVTAIPWPPRRGTKLQLRWNGLGLLDEIVPLNDRGQPTGAGRGRIRRDALGRPLRWGDWKWADNDPARPIGDVRRFVWDLDCLLVMEHDKRWMGPVAFNAPALHQRMVCRILWIPDESGRPLVAIREPVDNLAMPWESADSPAKEAYLLVSDHEERVTHWMNERGMCYPADELVPWQFPPAPGWTGVQTEWDETATRVGRQRGGEIAGWSLGLFSPFDGDRLILSERPLSERRGEVFWIERDGAGAPVWRELERPLRPRPHAPNALVPLNLSRYWEPPNTPRTSWAGLWGVPLPLDLGRARAPEFPGLVEAAPWGSWLTGVGMNALARVLLAVAASGVAGPVGLAATAGALVSWSAVDAWRDRTETYQRLTGRPMEGWRAALTVACDVLPISDLYALCTARDIATGRGYSEAAYLQLALGLLLDEGLGRALDRRVVQQTQTQIQLATMREMAPPTARYFSETLFSTHGGLHEGNLVAPDIRPGWLESRSARQHSGERDALFTTLQSDALTPELPALRAYKGAPDGLRRALTLADLWDAGPDAYFNPLQWGLYLSDKTVELRALARNYLANRRRSSTTPAGPFDAAHNKYPGDLDTAVRSMPNPADLLVGDQHWMNLPNPHASPRERYRQALTRKLNRELAALNGLPGAIYLDEVPSHLLVKWIFPNFDGQGSPIDAARFARSGVPFVKPGGAGKLVTNRRPYNLAPVYWPVGGRPRLPPSLGQIPALGAALRALDLLGTHPDEVNLLGPGLGALLWCTPDLKDVEDESRG